MGKIIIGYGASQYDVLLYFTKEMAKGFEKRAKEVILVEIIFSNALCCHPEVFA